MPSSSSPPSSTPEAAPRWTCTVTPLPNSGEATISLHVHAEDVLAGEVAAALAKATAILAARSTARLPTEAEGMQIAERERLLRECPALYVYLRSDGEEPIWLGEQGVAELDELLRANGWRRVSAPDGARVVCTFAADPVKARRLAGAPEDAGAPPDA